MLKLAIILTAATVTILVADFFRKQLSRTDFREVFHSFKAKNRAPTLQLQSASTLPLRAEAGKRIVSAGRTNRSDPSNRKARPSEGPHETAQAPICFDRQTAPRSSRTAGAGGKINVKSSRARPRAGGT